MNRLVRKALGFNIVYLIVSYLIFPVSLKFSLFCFGCFLVGRFSVINSNYYRVILQAVVGIVIAIAIIKLYGESLSHFYPVSIYDYLLLLITVAIIKINPLKTTAIYQTCWAICWSLLILFVCNLSSLDFSIRNHWGLENPNWLGLYCSMCLPIILCLAIDQVQQNYAKPAVSKLMAKILLLIPIIAFFLSLLMIVSSGSRSSLYTSLLIIVLMLVKLLQSCSIRPLKQQSKMMVSSVFLFLSALIYQVFLSKFSFLNRFIDIANSTNIYRIKLYQCHLEVGWQKPWWGWGIDRASAICEQKFRAGYGGVNHAHNFILQLFADHGLMITLPCLLIICYFLVFPAIKLMAKSALNSQASVIYWGISLSSISILMISLFQSGFYHYPLFPLWLGLLWGCQLSFIEMNKNN